MATNLQDAVATVVDPKAHADPARLHAAYGWLRKNDPVARAEIERFDPFFIVTKHADILKVKQGQHPLPLRRMPSATAR